MVSKFKKICKAIRKSFIMSFIALIIYLVLVFGLPIYEMSIVGTPIEKHFILLTSIGFLIAFVLGLFLYYDEGAKI